VLQRVREFETGVIVDQDKQPLVVTDLGRVEVAGYIRVDQSPGIAGLVR
jgi:hypothetical protein